MIRKIKYETRIDANFRDRKIIYYIYLREKPFFLFRIFKSWDKDSCIVADTLEEAKDIAKKWREDGIIESN